MRKHKPFDPDHYAKILKDLDATSLQLQVNWNKTLDPDHIYADYLGWVDPEDRQDLDAVFYDAIAAVNTAVKYRENTGAYHSGN